MARFTHRVSGVVVSVADEKVLGSDWRAEGETERSETPDASWKVADLKAYAEENGIDLGDATKKADILAALDDSADDDGNSDNDESNDDES
ncbi:hypothetical protein FVO59_11955 [Microbacterium esteraromaticum]|uniref:Rho termination factor N-terminal domain-containing protein n=1 Tax=Microbacterium esteraromaticum TaxID=57043 RepID=A0A7D7WFP1_9MICO|nr:hypothetical protein [Microbacterium esteraromaticum]QMU97839.1 hypothetical protein FVO59_11955 [Microbacterium esteraromaticum]